MIFARWRARRASRALIDQIHGEIVAAARDPVLYTVCEVRDDVDGRFEMTTLHADLILRRLTELGAAELAQELVDRVFEAFDDALREMAVSDIGVAKRMTKMAGAYFGRAKAYAASLESEDAAGLAEALARNALRTGDAASPTALRLAERTLSLKRRIAEIPLEAFLTGRFRYPEPEAVP